MADTKLSLEAAATALDGTELLDGVQGVGNVKITTAQVATLVKNPPTSDGAALGTTALMWSDLFLASGAVVNFNNGDMTITHAADALTVAGGQLVVPQGVASTAPGIAFAGALTTGFYYNGGPVATVGGVQKVGFGSSALQLNSAMLFGWTNSATDPISSLADTVLARLGAASVRQGHAPSATPIAQAFTLGEASRSGTDTNTAGANGTIRSGSGTGTGAVSSLLFQTPIAVAGGSGAQTPTTGLAVKNGTALLTGYTVATLPAGTQGARAFVTDATAPTYLGALTGGGAVVCPVFYNGTAWVSC